jgi:hypothetical protein
VNVGQGANTTVANAGQNMATNVANLITSNGANQAAAGVAGTNALTGALNTGANAFTSNYLLSQLNGGAGGALNATSSYGPLDLNGLANQQPAYNYATMGG